MRLAAVALAALVATGAAHAVSTYSFAYEGTLCHTSPCTTEVTPWSGTLALLLYGDGAYGITWGNTSDGYTGRDIDPNTEITLSVDGQRPLALSRNFSVTVWPDADHVSFYGNAQQPGAPGSNGLAGIYIFGNGQIELGRIDPDHVETYGHGTITPVPEPESWALMLLGGLGLVGFKAKRKGTRA